MPRFEILAHRGNVDGPNREEENSLAACTHALESGFGLETDLRRAGNGRYYISHDVAAATSDNALEPYRSLFQRHSRAVIAINVKELGYESELIRLQREEVFGSKGFYFDFELIEPTMPGRSQILIRNLPGGDETRLAARISDRGESMEQCLSIPANFIWADEFGHPWLAETTIDRMRESGRKIYVVSPELHGFDRGVRLSRWADFKAWRVDGICTDFAGEAMKYFNE